MADMKKPMPKNTSTRNPVVKPAPLGVAPKAKPKSLGLAPKGSERKPATPAAKAAAAKAAASKKPAPLKGPAAIKELQRQVSPKGVKKTEEGAKKGLDKKYPGLYKKSK
jgi:hypothetical protein